MYKPLPLSKKIFAVLLGIAITLLNPTTAYAQTFQVNTTDDLDDGVCDATHCSLREAINEANANIGLDVIRFDSLPAGSIIVLDDLLPAITNNETKIRADLHPAYTGTPVIGIDGSMASASVYTGLAPGTLIEVDFGLFTIESSNNLIRGLAIFGFDAGPAITVYGPGPTANVIRGSYLGPDLTGTSFASNRYGVFIYQATNTIILDNVISGNLVTGIDLIGDGVTNTSIRSNKIGTDSTGTLDLGNDIGIRLIHPDAAGIGPSNNTIGGPNTSNGNLISGNVTGIMLTNANQNTIQNNLIGTDVSGSAALGNALAGIVLFDASDNNEILDNLVSANGYFAILIEGANNLLQGNKVGTDAAGTTAMGNWGGILIESSTGGNLIGGPGAGEGNLLSGNTHTGGVRVFGASTISNTIQGNQIGTDETGSAAIGNAIGVELGNGSTNTLVLDNVISGNAMNGITFYSSTGSVIQGNLIGTDSSGTAALGNGWSGIDMGSVGAQGTLIGGSGPGQGNIISGNGTDPLVINGDGIAITGADNLVQGNFIGTDISGSVAIPNDGAGVVLQGSTNAAWPLENNQIGGGNPGMGNVISGNNEYAIILGGGSNFATDTIIQNNFIGTDASGGSPIPNSGGVAVNGTGTLIGGPNAGNLIAFNTGPGIVINGSGFYSWIIEHTFSRNSIYQNDGLGIDLGGDGVTPNDAGDSDVGPNGFLNFPEITSFASSLVEGTACDGCLVEVFAVDEDPSGSGEGITFLGDGLATGGMFSVDVSGAGLGICDKVTTTATDADGNTSEFSPNTAPTDVSCLGSETVVPTFIILVPAVLAGGWVFYRRRSLPPALGGFLVGAVFGGAVLIFVGIIGRTRVSSISPAEVAVPERDEAGAGDLFEPPPQDRTPPPYQRTPVTPEITAITITDTPTPTATKAAIIEPRPTETFTPFVPTQTFTPVPPADTSAPKVGSINASPNPALTTSPVTISAVVTDSSGVASVMLYYRTGKGAYMLAGTMKTGGGNTYTLNIGALTPAGTYDFSILATDTLGNATCGPKNLSACPGGTFVVNIP